ncbi:AraC family transcriptional regulator [Agromyces sp. SYSU K20354]|uniref:AraC family transcriptional regulator n=1 Tax=Agromyces cavernae TaxID=2898659 RepID=UPI001E38C169|nr:AraC family transcriptional regulator [Agromyces cavernae]MCD2443645.1 AraC family transcriptional regulator [Agromyces cavernae]
MSAIELQARAAPEVDLEARAIDDVLARLHWSVLEFAHWHLPEGTARRDDGPGVRFLFVVSGGVELRAVGQHAVGDSGERTEPLAMQSGDFVLLPSGGGADVRGRADSVLLSGSLALDGSGNDLTRAMPPVLFTCGFRVEEPVFASLLDTMYREMSSARAGSDSVIRRLADVVASAAVRFWLERGCGSALDWLASVRDPNLRRAVEAIHDDPGSPWTVESLARVARSSRSQFAEQFRLTVGDSPARYLTRIRMEHAERMLRAGVPVGDIAYRLGYESEAGFSRAFRRHSGSAPSRWRRALLQRLD